MPSPWSVAGVWRIIRDIDLEGIQASALAPFELWVAADDPVDAGALLDLLSPSGARHPWILTFAPDAVPGAAASAVIATVLVSRTSVLSEPLRRVAHAMTAARVPVVTVVLGETGPAASAQGSGEDARVAVTAMDDSAVAPLAATLLSVIPRDRRLALGRQLPPVRATLFDGLIHETAQANASFALTTGLAETVPLLTAPLNVGDIVVLTKNQLMLGYRIVLASGRSGDPRRLIREIIGVLGGGLLFRQIARQLVGLIPVAGLVPKVAIAYSGTWAIGRAIAAWANEGRTITGDLVRGYSAEALGRGRALAERLVTDARSGALRLRRRG